MSRMRALSSADWELVEPFMPTSVVGSAAMLSDPFRSRVTLPYGFP